MMPLAVVSNAYAALTIFAPALNGVLAVAAYQYLKRNSGLSSRLCVLGAFFTIIQYSVLRLSWDMFSESLALSFGLFTLILMLAPRLSLPKSVAVSLMLVATGLANQMVLLTLLPIACYRTVKVSSAGRSKILALAAILIPSLAFLFWSWKILQGASAFPAAQGVKVWFFWSNSSSAGISPFANYLALFNYPDLVAVVTGFLLFLYLPLLPWIRRKSVHGLVSNWTLISLLVVVSPLILPWFTFDLWYLWAITLSVPLSIIAFQGLAGFADRIGNLRGGRLRALVLVLLLMPYVVVGAGYMTLPPERPVPIFAYPAFLSYVPSSMLANSVPLHDSLDALTLLAKLNATMDQHSVLLVHEAFYGFTALSISGDKFIINYHLGDPMSAVSYAKTLGFEKIYWIWWLPGYGWFGLTNPPQGFSILLQMGDMAIYQFNH
jgi:hypothetical protein